MTSEAIEESGRKDFTSALLLGTGSARWRFGSYPGEANEPESMGWGTWQENGELRGGPRDSRHYPVIKPPAQSGHMDASRFYAECVLEASHRRGRDGFDVPASWPLFINAFLTLTDVTYAVKSRAGLERP